MTPRAPRSRVALGAGLAFVLLTMLVATGSTREADVAVRDEMRPGDVWGDAQLRADVVVEGLRPEVLVALLLATAVVVSLLRRSWRPTAYAVLLAAVASVPTLATKAALARTDPHDDLSSLGSFPSGHTLFVVVGLGGMLLLARGNTVWWDWLVVAAAGAAMGVALLLQAAHWSTDVIGGALLGACVLAATSGSAPRPGGPGTGRPGPPPPG